MNRTPNHAGTRAPTWSPQNGGSCISVDRLEPPVRNILLEQPRRTEVPPFPDCPFLPASAAMTLDQGSIIVRFDLQVASSLGFTGQFSFHFR